MEPDQNHSRPIAQHLTPVNPPERLVFYPVAVVAGLFVLTILMTVASAFGDPDAPVNHWLNRNATNLILAETGLLTCVAVGSMTIDRIKTIRRQKRSAISRSLDEIEEESSDVG